MNRLEEHNVDADGEAWDDNPLLDVTKLPKLDPEETVKRLMAEQGITPEDCVKDHYGAGADWWTDEEFEEFLAHLRATRAEKD